MTRKAILIVAAATLLAPGSASAAVKGFRNATPIAVPGVGTAGPASPYPSAVTVSGMTGPITDVSVTLHGVSHTEPEQMRVMLVSPSGTAVLLMDFDCGSQEVVDASWIFTEKALAEIPDNGPCDGTVYRPTGSISSLAWPPDAPYYKATLGLGKFMREDANGTWKLYVADATSTETGKIAGGWTLAVETFDGPIDMLVPEAGSSGAASTYPSTRTVSGQAGVISDVNVGIDGIWHQSPDDLDMLLVGPAGQKVVLASGACGEPGVEALNWSFDDEAAGPLSDLGPCTSGSYRPTDYAPGDYWPPGPPPAPYGTSLAALDGTDPNGEWQLFVADSLFYDVGFITNRFSLSMTTRPKATAAFAQSALTVPEGATRQLVVTRAATGALGAGAVTVTSAPGTARSASDFTPISTTLQFAPEEREKTIQLAALTDRETEPDETFAVALSNATGDADATATPAIVTIRNTSANSAGAADDRPGTDRGAPVIGRVTLAPATFAVTGRSSARAARRGTTIRYSLSEPAAVTLRFQRRACRPHRSCRRYVAAGTLRRNGLAGVNRVVFNGRIGRRALRPGSYRLVVTAIDRDGNRSSSRPRAFRIVA